ncbi:MAG: 2-phosphosulfolactate phosphatase [Acidobacteria bacterium]|nr:2-phosphosulfolactate phosphatase [Acidobacteriota bacterium]MDW7984391.1 2-phosphosulfolactate phosphatase [Acidobacteriota bacterium]
MTLRILDDCLYVGAGPAAAQMARDLQAEAVVFDVLRACATLTTLLASPVQTPVWVSDSVEACRRVQASLWPDVRLGGERNSRPIPGFDFGNSPVEILRRSEDLAGCRVILTTTSGTRALVAGPRGHTWVGSLTNLQAVIDQVRTWYQAGRRVLLVAVSGQVDEDPWVHEDLYVVLHVLWHITPASIETWAPDLAARWERHQGEPDWPGVLRSTSHGQELVDLGLGEDVTWIGESASLYPWVPVVGTSAPPDPHLAPVHRP